MCHPRVNRIVAFFGPWTAILVFVALSAGAHAQPTAWKAPSGEVQRSVSKWRDLTKIDGRSAHRSVFVQERARAGDVVFESASSLPAWAQGADILGLCVTDASGAGKWLHRWSGPVDISRLNPTPSAGLFDPSSALQELVDAGFDAVHFSAGTYFGSMNFPVVSPLTITGDGPDRTVFVGTSSGGTVAFQLDTPGAALTLADVGFEQQARLVALNPSSSQNLGTLTVRLRNVDIESAFATSPNSALIFSIPQGPKLGTTARLELEDCDWLISGTMRHVHVSSGFSGWIRDCSFRGGRFGILNAPANVGDFASTVGNDFFEDFRLTNCVFADFDYTGAGDSYHMQVVGRRWVISGCSFLSDDPVSVGTKTGCIYSGLQNSQIVGCSFVGGRNSQLYFKGSSRFNKATNPMGSYGWGNSVIGCTFDGFSPTNNQVGQVWLNVKEQRFIGCSFRDYQWYGINVTHSAARSDNLLIDGCEFSSGYSRSAIRLEMGGRNIRVRNCVFADITGSKGDKTGAILFHPTDQSSDSLEFDDMLVENCSFLNNDWAPIQFYPTAFPYSANRLRFVRNTVQHPSGSGFQGTQNGNLTITDLILEDNTIHVGDQAWNNMPLGCVARSTGNRWTHLNGAAPPPEAVGIGAGTVVVDETALAISSTLDVPPTLRVARVSGATAPVTISLDDGVGDGQRIMLVGASNSRAVTLLDSGNLALASSRTLGAEDTLTLLWVQAAAKWCEVEFSDN